MKRIAIVALFVALFAAGRAEAAGHAFLVGIEGYRGAPLEYTADDMLHLRDRLAAIGFSRIEVLTDQAGATKPTKANIEAALTRFLRGVGKNDTLVFAFSGHGASIGEGQIPDSYLIPADSTTSSDTWIKMKDLYDLLQKNTPPGHASKVLLIDACRSQEKNEPAGAADGTFKARNSAVKAFNAVAEDFVVEFPPPGMVVVSSCAAREFSVEDRELGHGVFTYFLAKGLAGAADTNKDRKVDITELYNYVCPETIDHVSANEERKPENKRLTQTPELKGILRTPIVLGSLEKQLNARFRGRDLQYDSDFRRLLNESDGLPEVRGYDLSGCKMRDLNLTDVDFSGSKLTGADLTRANLTRANFDDVDAGRATFDSCTVVDARFDGVESLEGATFRDVNISSAESFPPLDDFPASALVGSY